MNHPQPETWLAYLERELPAETTKELAAHLERCPDCAAELERSQQTIARLKRWRWPISEAARGSWAAPALKWGIAAALLLGLGFGWGRWATIASQNSILAQRLRTELRAELQADLLAALSPNAAAIKSSFQNELRVRLAGVAAAAVTDAQNAQRKRLAKELLHATDEGRQNDQRVMLALVQRVQEQHAADYLSLRRDLETLASTADERLQQARWRLDQLSAQPLAANSRP